MGVNEAGQDIAARSIGDFFCFAGQLVCRDGGDLAVLYINVCFLRLAAGDNDAVFNNVIPHAKNPFPLFKKLSSFPRWNFTIKVYHLFEAVSITDILLQLFKIDNCKSDGHMR